MYNIFLLIIKKLHFGYIYLFFNISSTTMPIPLNEVQENDEGIDLGLPFVFVKGTYKNVHRLFSLAEKQLYKRTHVLKDTQRYSCTTKGCPATVTLAGNFLKKVAGSKPHSHDNTVLISTLQLVDENIATPNINESTSSVKEQDPIPFVFTPGARVNSELVYTTTDKHLYRLKSIMINYKRYVCVIKECHASLKLVGDVLEKPVNFKDHNHASAEETQAKNVFLNDLKKAVAVSDVPVSQVFTQHLIRYLFCY